MRKLIDTFRKKIRIYHEKKLTNDMDFQSFKDPNQLVMIVKIYCVDEQRNPTIVILTN